MAELTYISDLYVENNRLHGELQQLLSELRTKQDDARQFYRCNRKRIIAMAVAEAAAAGVDINNSGGDITRLEL